MDVFNLSWATLVSFISSAPSSRRCTECTHGAISSERDRNQQNNSYTQANEKLPPLKWIGKAETDSCHKPHPLHVPYNQKGTPNSQLLPEEQRTWTPHRALQLLRLPPPNDGPSKHLTMKVNGACVHETHKTIANKEAVLSGQRTLTMVLSSGHCAERAGKTACLPVFP